jgi:hypothetical protein
MSPARFLLPLLLLLSAALLIIACSGKSGPVPQEMALSLPHWPPDTMMVSLVGSGRIAVRASWNTTFSKSALSPPVTYLLLMPHTPSDTTPSAMRLVHTPPDTTPSGQIAAILSGPASVSSGSGLVFAKWPPDTTKSAAK